MKRHLDPAAHDAPANGQKRRKQYTEQDAELARLFDRLADEARDVRLNAAKELVLKLSSSPTAELANKAIVRLIRGLNSGRKAARFGFFVALTETLRQLYGSSSKEIPGLEPNIHGLVKLVAELTTPEGKASGQEKRDYLLGRVFGYKAIIQSSVLVQPNAPEECWANVLEQLFKLAREKPWLREECGMILCEAVKAIAQEKGQQRLVKQIVDGLCSDGLAKTPEGVAVWITVQKEIPDMELPQGVWHKEDPLSTKDRQTLANVMKENFTKTSDGANETGKKVKGSSQATTLSFSWDVVISAFFQRHGDDPSRFANFWADIVDNNLFSASSSPEQKSKGLQLFTRMLGNAPKWALPSIFSPNLMRCLINQRNDPERFLHNAAKAPLDEMRTRSKKEPETAAPFLENLITKHGSLHFDQITKNKTVEGVLGHANDAALEQIVPLFKRLIYRPEEQDSKAAEAQRRTVADMVVSAVRSRNKENAIGNDSWLRKVLISLTELAYFTPTASSSPDDLPLPAVSEASRNMFQGRLTSCLAHLLSSKLDGEMDYPYIVVSAIRSKSKSSKSLSLVFQADKGISKAVKQAHKQVEEITEKLLKARDKKKPAFRAFKLLFSLTIIQVYNGDPDAVSILEELAVCYESAFQKGADKSAFQLLTEVLLSFAAKPSVLFRKLSEQVFTVFASELTAEGLHSMIDILSKKESMSGQQDLFDHQGSEDGEEASEDDEDEQDSDVEMVEADGSDVEEVEEASDDDDEEEEEDENEEDGEDGSDADDEELEKFNAALAKTLNTSMPTGEGEDSDDDDEADMDDDQMMALEPHLTKIFKQRQEAANKSKKKDNKDAKATMINFKNRVLDLLLIFVKQQHTNPLALDVIIPLLQLIRQTTAKQLSEKATNLLKQYFDATKKGMPTLDNDEDVDRVWSLLEDIHTEVTKDASKLHAGACSRASLFVAKVLVARDEEGKAESYGKVADLYTRTQKQWYADPKSKVHPSFFNEWINWSVGMRKNQ